MFFGQAGLLEEDLDDPYYLMLQKEYRYLSRKFELRQMEPSQWKFLRLRPGNFPPVRLAQLASLYYRAQGLFSRIIEAETLADVKGILSTGTSAGHNFYILRNRRRHRRERKTSETGRIHHFSLC